MMVVNWERCFKGYVFVDPWELAKAVGMQSLCCVLIVAVVLKCSRDKKMGTRDAMGAMRMDWYVVRNVVSSDWFSFG